MFVRVGYLWFVDLAVRSDTRGSERSYPSVEGSLSEMIGT